MPDVKLPSRGWTAVIAVLVVFLVLVTVLWLTDNEEPTSLPDWITALAAVVALAFAAAAATSSSRQLDLLRDDARARSQREKAAQARRVYYEEVGLTGTESFRILNLSDEPLVDVLLCISGPDGPRRIYLGGLMPTGAEGVPLPMVDTLIGEIREKFVGRSLGDDFKGKGAVVAAVWGPACYRVDLYFLDVLGYRWHRDHLMSLTEVDRQSYGAPPKMAPPRGPDEPPSVIAELPPGS